MKKKVSSNSFQTNDRIFAKIKGYPPWPACVTGPNDTKGARYKVYFYGTYEYGIVNKEDMWPFDESTKAKYGKPAKYGYKKCKGFDLALKEIEFRPEAGYLTFLPNWSEKETLEGDTSGDTIILEESVSDMSNLDESKVKIEASVDEKVAALSKSNATSVKKCAKRKANTKVSDLEDDQMSSAKVSKMKNCKVLVERMPFDKFMITSI